KDHVSAHGQTIDLKPAAPGKTLVAYVLLTSASSRFEVPLTFLSAMDNGGERSIPLSITVDPWTDATERPGDETAALEFPTRLQTGGGGLGPPRLEIVSVPVASPEEITKLKLPDTPDLRIFGLTVRPLSEAEIDAGFRKRWIAHRYPSVQTQEYLRNLP